jgi:hypothetical protein
MKKKSILVGILLPRLYCCSIVFSPSQDGVANRKCVLNIESKCMLHVKSELNHVCNMYKLVIYLMCTFVDLQVLSNEISKKQKVS